MQKSYENWCRWKQLNAAYGGSERMRAPDLLHLIRCEAQILVAIVSDVVAMIDAAVRESACGRILVVWLWIGGSASRMNHPALR